MVGDVHTVHRQGAWLNTIAGGADLSGTFDTKDEAVAAGRDEARKREVEHIIHKLDGTIAQRNSYGNDPRTVPG